MTTPRSPLPYRTVTPRVFVSDVEAAVAELRGRGVEPETYEAPPGCTFRDGVMDYGTVKAAWFKDSEGNLISIAKFGGE